MKCIDLTFPTPEQNLACDEALLHWCEERFKNEILRFWESRHYFAVLGYTRKVKLEVDLPSCQTHHIPVLRRCTGGGTVLQGPGCLNYSLILKVQDRAQLKGIAETNTFIMKSLKTALKPLVDPEIEIKGVSDLALGALKFSGNAQYRRRDFLLFHGTLLLGFDISLVEKFLSIPVKQPSYRQNRSHERFLTNLNLPEGVIKRTLQKSWSATEELKDIPFDSIESLVQKRYAKDEWNFKF
jgi:lipoate-protein ligase A